MNKPKVTQNKPQNESRLEWNEIYETLKVLRFCHVNEQTQISSDYDGLTIFIYVRMELSELEKSFLPT